MVDCSVGMLEFEGKPAELVTAIDITKRKQAEGEIRQALEQKKNSANKGRGLSLWFLMNSAPAEHHLILHQLTETSQSSMD